jgi:hypothetical protein
MCCVKDGPQARLFCGKVTAFWVPLMLRFNMSLEDDLDEVDERLGFQTFTLLEQLFA